MPKGKWGTNIKKCKLTKGRVWFLRCHFDTWFLSFCSSNADKQRIPAPASAFQVHPRCTVKKSPLWDFSVLSELTRDFARRGRSWRGMLWAEAELQFVLHSPLLSEQHLSRASCLGFAAIRRRASVISTQVTCYTFHPARTHNCSNYYLSQETFYSFHPWLATVVQLLIFNTRILNSTASWGGAEPLS